MPKIAHTFIQSGRYYFRRRARLTKSLNFIVTLSLRTREPVVAAHRASALSVYFGEVQRRVVMFIRENDFLTHEMAKEIFDCELRPFLDDLILGYFGEYGPEFVADWYRTRAAAYRLAHQPAADVEMSPEHRERLLRQGFDKFTVEDVACDLDRLAHRKNLNWDDIGQWIASFGMTQSQASYGAVQSHMIRARCRAYELASRYLDPEIQEAIDPVSALLARAQDESFRPHGMQGSSKTAGEVTPAPAQIMPRQASPAPESQLTPPQPSSFFLTYSQIRFADIIGEVAASLKADGRWNGDITQQIRIMRSFAWITGNKALGDYTHLDVAAFKSALQLLPRDFKFHEHFDKPYELAEASVRKQKATFEVAKDEASKTGKPVNLTKVKSYTARKAATINRDV